MKFHSLFGMLALAGCCMLTGTIHAQASDLGKTLTLTPLEQAHKYRDSFGQTYTVNPESGGSICDPNGCVVQVCQGGACSYYYCTVTKCTPLRMAGAS
ncbi:hypothetical protein [Dyella tabacisoli]